MILADTGFWVALAASQDHFHDAARRLAQEHADEGFVCTWPVITESVYLIGKRLGLDARLRFMKQLSSGICLIEPLPADAWSRMERLMFRYRDLPMDMADASLVLLAEEMGESRILSTDGDFGIYRWKNTKPFKNLLLEG